jgi:hypothetical protein
MTKGRFVVLSLCLTLLAISTFRRIHRGGGSRDPRQLSEPVDPFRWSKVRISGPHYAAIAERDFLPVDADEGSEMGGLRLWAPVCETIGGDDFCIHHFLR